MIPIPPEHCPDCAKRGDRIELTSYACCPVCGYEWRGSMLAADDEVVAPILDGTYAAWDRTPDKYNGMILARGSWAEVTSAPAVVARLLSGEQVMFARTDAPEG